MNSFIQRHSSAIVGVLNGFDRVRVRGTLRWLCYPDGMGKYLSKMKVLLKDFKSFTTSITDMIRQASTQAAESAGRPVKYLSSPSTRKEDVAREIAEQDDIQKGLICILSSVEPCWSFAVGPNPHTRQLELRYQQRKCLHYYHYHMHPQLGFMHVRFQTWFPFTVHVCLNGREWLARQLDQAGVAYLRKGNCFVRIADLSSAQKRLDRQLRENWRKLLDALVPQFNPLHTKLISDGRAGYYWSIESSEWATDIMFEDAASLGRLYPLLIRHGMQTLGSREVLRFLGRRLQVRSGVHPNFSGEVISDLRERPEGVRIKHRVNSNSVKMYDKQGSVLRVETTINDAQDIKVYRRAEGDPSGEKRWRSLRKTVADVYRRAQVSQAANERYLASMATLADHTPLGDLVEKHCQPLKWRGKRVRALNPLSSHDACLLQAANQGEFLINGFRNRDLRRKLFGEDPADKEQHKRRAAAVTRKIRLLRAHGLVRKVSKTRRYIVTKKGQIIMNALSAARTADIHKLTAAA